MLMMASKLAPVGYAWTFMHPVAWWRYKARATNVRGNVVSLVTESRGKMTSPK